MIAFLKNGLSALAGRLSQTPYAMGLLASVPAIYLLAHYTREPFVFLMYLFPALAIRRFCTPLQQLSAAGFFVGFVFIVGLFERNNDLRLALVLHLPLIALYLFLDWMLAERFNQTGRALSEQNERWEIRRRELEIRQKTIFAQMESGQKKFHKYLMLNRISRLFSIHLDLRKLADEIILRMAELLGADRGVYHVQLNVHDPANLIIRNRPTGATLPLLEDQYQRWVHEHRQPLLVADAQDDFRFTYTPTMEKRCLMLGPLLSGDTVIGYLRAEAETPGVFNYEDLQLFSILAEMSAGAVDNARLYRRAQELAITDGLTGLVLRRFFYQRFEEELGRFHEQRTPFTLVMLDLDHFKLINDRYLHAVGDQVLAQIAEILRLEARVADVLCRFGGEEFAILLPNTPLEGGMVMAERIRKQVERKKFKAREIFFNVTISAGLGECPQHGRDIKTLIRTADQALYRAKHQGRNQVVVAVKEPGHAAG